MAKYGQSQGSARTGRPLTRQAIYGLTGRLCRAAGVFDRGPHGVRARWSRSPTSAVQSLGSTAFRELRPAQAAGLESYAASHSATPDLAIELLTGVGKSLIALLICEAWRQYGKTVAVLTGNKTLARQMEAEGRALGVPVERFEGAGSSIPLPRRRRYRRAQAIGVMSYWVMFNQNPVVDSADLLVARSRMPSAFVRRPRRGSRPTGCPAGLRGC